MIVERTITINIGGFFQSARTGKAPRNMNRVPATKFVPAKEISAVRIGLPILVMLAATYLTYGYCFFLPYRHFLAAAGVTVGLMYIYGPSGKTVGNLAQKTGDWLLPTTAKAWGILAMVASFLLLGIGAAVSFRKRVVPTATPVAGSDVSAAAAAARDSSHVSGG